MKPVLQVFGAALAALLAFGAGALKDDAGETAPAGESAMEKVVKSEAEWEKTLTPEQFCVARRHGTERAFTGVYHDHKEPGVYRCVACGLELFSSGAKFDSGSGWPSFFQPITADRLGATEDRRFGMTRTEVHCRRCGAHLGHVFDDGPAPTGRRYCINSVVLDFRGEDKEP